MLQLWNARAARSLASVFIRSSTRGFSSDGFSTEIGDIGPTDGSTRQQNRVGRGPGSGRGKTAGRGQKGQHARAGVKPWFEGGQVPLYLRFPKFGFRSRIYKPVELNLGDLQALINSGKIDASKPITMKELRTAGVSSGSDYGIKLLARGSEFFSSQVEITATRATQEAINRIEELGGKFTSQYYTPMGFATLTRPEVALKKWARIPLRARPISRRAIEYYRNPEARGYLVDAPGAPATSKLKVTFEVKKGELVALMDRLEQGDASSSVAEGFGKSTSLKTAASE